MNGRVGIGTTGSPVPCQRLRRAHATYTPSTARPARRPPPGSGHALLAAPSSRGPPPSPVLMPSLGCFDASAVVYTRSSSRHTPDPLVAGRSRSRFPPRLLTGMTLRWFGISACTANPEGQPPSLAQHGSCRRPTPSPTLPFQDARGGGPSPEACLVVGRRMNDQVHLEEGVRVPARRRPPPTRPPQRRRKRRRCRCRRLASISRETHAILSVGERKCLSCNAERDFSKVSHGWREATPQVKSIAAVSRVKVSVDGHGVVSHVGVGMRIVRKKRADSQNRQVCAWSAQTGDVTESPSIKRSTHALYRAP